MSMDTQKKIVQVVKAWLAHERDGDTSEHPGDHELFNDITLALSAESSGSVKEGHVRLPDGQDVKVLGELVLTLDGCLPGNECTLYYPARPKPRPFEVPGEPRRVINECAHLKLAASTREAALASAPGPAIIEGLTGLRDVLKRGEEPGAHFKISPPPPQP